MLPKNRIEGAFLFCCCLLVTIPAVLQYIEMQRAAEPQFSLSDSGLPLPLNYEQFGNFAGAGSDKFVFEIKDASGLKAAAGAGVHPNDTAILDDPAYLRWRREHPETKNPWDYTSGRDAANDFYVWAGQDGRTMDPAARQFYSADALERANLYMQALKGYYAILLYFPKAMLRMKDSEDHWHVCSAALDRIWEITEAHPELGVELEGALCEVLEIPNRRQPVPEVIVHPGRWRKRSF